MSASCTMLGLTLTEYRPLNPVRSAEDYLVAEGLVSRRTKLKRLSAKKIAEIVLELRRVNQERSDHHCGDFYQD